MYHEQAVGRFSPDTDGALCVDQILIVIPCLNERPHIQQLIVDVLNDTAELDRLVVVVDGGSTDGTQALLAKIAAQETHVAVIANPKKIQSAGVNLAVAALGDERRWFIRLDAHASYPPGYIQSLIGEARRTGAASVVVAIRSQGVGCFQSAVALAQNSLLGAGGSPHRRGGKAAFVDHGHHALFDLAHFKTIGGYDESLSHNEDAELDIRLVRAGGKIWLTRTVDMVYFPRSNITQLYSQYTHYGRGRAKTFLRHRQPPKLRQLLPLGVAPAVAALLCTPWIAMAGIPALFWISICLLAGAALGMRRGVRAALFTGIAAMTMHFAWSVGFWCEVLSRRWQWRSPDFNTALGASDEAS